jgi:hypothetical protein
MRYTIKINGRPHGLSFPNKRTAINAVLAVARSEGGVTEFAEYRAGKGAWVCTPLNQYDVRRLH